MYSIIVSDGQSLLDISLQELGDVAAVFDLADANELAITDPLTPGQPLLVPASLLGRPEVARYFHLRAKRINTGNTPIGTVPAAKVARYFDPAFFNHSFFE